eukprot:GEMP01001032.1.p1 GENE.GEMP01001032.1~~GEMP01001032.1.p1  ORF type:complete len:586 (+),score=112.58 GEMP01001032.1:317-2074(+)
MDSENHVANRRRTRCSINSVLSSKTLDSQALSTFYNMLARMDISDNDRHLGKTDSWPLASMYERRAVVGQTRNKWFKDRHLLIKSILEGERVFRDFMPDSLALVIDKLKFEEFPPEHVLIQRNRKTNKFYFICGGDVGIYLQREQLMRERFQKVMQAHAKLGTKDTTVAAKSGVKEVRKEVRIEETEGREALAHEDEPQASRKKAVKEEKPLKQQRGEAPLSEYVEDYFPGSVKNPVMSNSSLNVEDLSHEKSEQYKEHGVRVAVLKSGQIFGEKGLVRYDPPTFTAVCLTAVSCATLNKDVFTALLKQRVEEKEVERSAFLLQWIPGAIRGVAFEAFAACFKKERFPRGHQFCYQNEQLSNKSIRRLYIIVDGQCHITHTAKVHDNADQTFPRGVPQYSPRTTIGRPTRKPQPIGVLGRGQLIGYSSILNTHEPFDVIASSEVIDLFSISSTDFNLRLPREVKGCFIEWVVQHLSYYEQSMRRLDRSATVCERECEKLKQQNAKANFGVTGSPFLRRKTAVTTSKNWKVETLRKVNPNWCAARIPRYAPTIIGSTSVLPPAWGKSKQKSPSSVMSQSLTHFGLH